MIEQKINKQPEVSALDFAVPMGEPVFPVSQIPNMYMKEGLEKITEKFTTCPIMSFSPSPQTQSLTNLQGSPNLLQQFLFSSINTNRPPASPAAPKQKLQPTKSPSPQELQQKPAKHPLSFLDMKLFNKITKYKQSIPKTQPSKITFNETSDTKRMLDSSLQSMNAQQSQSTLISLTKNYDQLQQEHFKFVQSLQQILIPNTSSSNFQPSQVLLKRVMEIQDQNKKLNIQNFNLQQDKLNQAQFISSLQQEISTLKQEQQNLQKKFNTHVNDTFFNIQQLKAHKQVLEEVNQILNVDDITCTVDKLKSELSQSGELLHKFNVYRQDSNNLVAMNKKLTAELDLIRYHGQQPQNEQQILMMLVIALAEIESLRTIISITSNQSQHHSRRIKTEVPENDVNQRIRSKNKLADFFPPPKYSTNKRYLSEKKG